MNPSIRDGILRLSSDPNYSLFIQQLGEIRMLAVESLAYVLPDDQNTIARMQGRVQAIDEILDLHNQAERERDSETQLRTNNG